MKLERITGLQVSAYMLPNPTPPCCHVYPGEIQDYDHAMGRGMDLFRLTVQVLVPINDAISSQKNLDAYLAGSGARSIKQALELREAGEVQPTLGGLCHDLRVTMATGYRRYSTDSGPIALGCEWSVEVFVRGNS